MAGDGIIVIVVLIVCLFIDYAVWGVFMTSIGFWGSVGVECLLLIFELIMTAKSIR